MMLVGAPGSKSVLELAAKLRLGMRVADLWGWMLCPVKRCSEVCNHPRLWVEKQADVLMQLRLCWNATLTA